MSLLSRNVPVLVYDHEYDSHSAVLAVVFGLFRLIPEEDSSLYWPVMDLSCVDNDSLLYEDSGVIAMQEHAGIRYGDGYLCFTTYAVVFACRITFGPYVKLNPVFDLPPMTIGWPHKVLTYFNI